MPVGVAVTFLDGAPLGETAVWERVADYPQGASAEEWLREQRVTGTYRVDKDNSLWRCL